MLGVKLTLLNTVLKLSKILSFQGLRTVVPEGGLERIRRGLTDELPRLSVTNNMDVLRDR